MTHGLSAYTYRHCRCDICRAAKAASNQAFQRQRRARIQAERRAAWEAQHRSAGGTWPELVAAALERMEG
jgi:hypothetical protein